MKSLRIRSAQRVVGAAVIVAALSGFPSLARAQQAFPSPEAAAQALVDAVATSDDNALARVLGASWQRYIPTAGVDKDDVYAFLTAWAKSNKIVRDGADTAHLAIGADDWSLPIPLVQRAGGWRFDARAGADEIRTRRIGRNELAAMQASLAYYDAQKEYATTDRNGDGVLEYAQRIISTPGKQDGLYWADLPGEDESPLGPVFGGPTRRRLPRLFVQGAQGAGSQCQGRRIRLPDQGAHDGGLRARRLAAALRGHRGDDVHAGPPRQAVSEGSRAQHRRHRPVDDAIRSGRDVEGSHTLIPTPGRTHRRLAILNPEGGTQ